MIDPAALSTLIIGLDATRQDPRRSPATRQMRSQTRRGRTRQRFVAALRTMAARIEPARVPAR